MRKILHQNFESNPDRTVIIPKFRQPEFRQSGKVAGTPEFRNSADPTSSQSPKVLLSLIRPRVNFCENCDTPIIFGKSESQTRDVPTNLSILTRGSESISAISQFLWDAKIGVP